MTAVIIRIEIIKLTTITITITITNNKNNINIDPFALCAVTALYVYP